VRIAFAAVALVAAIVFGAVEAASAPSSFVLSLNRDYGRAVFGQCRLDVVVFENKGSSQLWCEHIKRPAVDPPPLFVRENSPPMRHYVSSI
jgi:hypothetical protein